jgi:hypothetical protein
MKEPWSIKSRARECAESGEPFEDGQQIRAAIFPDPDSSGYLRRDYKLESWDQREDDTPPFSTWLTTYEPPVIEEKPEDVVDQDPESLLTKLVEEDEEHTENARYILAVMLERKKILRETDTQEVPSGILRVYEHRKSGDVFLIKDPQIALADVDKVQEEVRQLLDPDPVPAGDPAEETTGESPSETEGTPEVEEVATVAADESGENAPDLGVEESADDEARERVEEDTSEEE